MAQYWNDDDRSLEGFSFCKYSPICDNDYVPLVTRNLNVFKSIHEDIDHSKRNFYNEVEYVNYIYEPPHSPSENEEDDMQLSQPLDESTHLYDEDIEPCYDLLTKNKFMYT